jgi:hypothetical protein
MAADHIWGFRGTLMRYSPLGGRGEPSRGWSGDEFRRVPPMGATLLGSGA